jgi:hypothetical protein
VTELLRSNRGDWEETAYQLLAQTMGTKVNAVPFLRLAKALPLKLLRKHGNSLLQMEALLFGQAGLLESTFADAYPNTLQREYGFMRHKYGLEASQVGAVAWKWARLRPANFPEVRIAQLAALLFERKNVFSAFLELGQTPDLPATFRVAPSAYWQTHYQFDKPSAKSQSSFGAGSQENLLINAVAPLLTAYAIEKDEMGFYGKRSGCWNGCRPRKTASPATGRRWVCRLPTPSTRRAALNCSTTAARKTSVCNARLGSTCSRTPRSNWYNPGNGPSRPAPHTHKKAERPWWPFCFFISGNAGTPSAC